MLSFFTVTGSNSIQQKQALDELANLLVDRTPHNLLLPRIPFPDARSNAARPNVVDPNFNHPSELLIDFSEDANDPPAATQQPSQAPPIVTETFVVDNRIQDPNRMFYPTKRQKTDLPEIIASSRNCTSVISNNSREITIQGESMTDVDRCIQDLQNMQAYFLRPHYRLEKVSLVYGSTRDPFRIILVPLPRHLYFSTHITYFPSDMPQLLNPSKYLVAIKASYDSAVGDWLPDPGALTILNLAPNGRPSSRQGTVRSPQGAGRGSPDDRSWGPAPTGGATEWYDQDSDGFGFGFGFADNLPSFEKSPSTSTHPLSTNSPRTLTNRVQWPSPAPRRLQLSQPSPSPSPSPSTSPSNLSLSNGSWLSPGGAKNPHSNQASSSPSLGRWGTQESSSRPDSRSPAPSSFAPRAQTSQGGIVRTVERSQWVAPTYESRNENDFPSLGGPGLSTKAPKKPGMPQLPSMRKPGESSWSSSPVSDSPSPKAAERLVFDDKAFEFLEKRSSSPKVNNNTDLAFPRRPGQDRDPRTLRALPSLQSDASQDVNSFINNMRSYNMRRLTQSMWAGLEELRGHRKEIRLFARLGKVLYKGPPSVCGQTWDHEQLENTVIRNLGVTPLFSPIVTTSSSSIENMFGFLGQPAVESAEFDVICDTRTNPQSRYVPTLVTVPPKVATLDRVVTPWETYAEVSWNSMDKNTDFEILLQSREGVIHDAHSALGRIEVKPFGAFRRSLSIGTHNKHISCREIPNYLEIRSINYKETRKYTFEDNVDLTVLVHNVQELKLTRIKETSTVTGRTFGDGNAWYEIEVYNDNLSRYFRSNLTLTEGLAADWNVKDILGSPTNSDELSKMVKNTMLVVDQCQARFKD
ncbi:hypothetical protein BG006_003661 [Podila minutissima]|uniref:DUF7905 domain-containing protein n=1 Tax=Podila minutissima TaxID=64525 RepID=A0A9P5VNE5_9FUNG|nr:hypothetical protein BG006_003661 [Podila minutissima]